MVETSFSVINQSLGTRKEAYNFASLVYYLPNFDCSCCNVAYLNEIIRDPCSYFKIEKNKVHPQHVSYRKYDAAYLLAYLEDYLFTTNIKPTGFSSLSPPNAQWLYDVILSLDPTDPLHLLASHPDSIAEKAVIKIDPK